MQPVGPDPVSVAWRVMWRAFVVLWAWNAAWVVVAFRDDEAIGPVEAVAILSIFLAMAFVPLLLLGGATTVALELLTPRVPFPVLLVVYGAAGVLLGAVATAALGVSALVDLDVSTVLVVVSGGVSAVVGRWWVHDAQARAGRRGAPRARPDSDEAVEDGIVARASDGTPR